MSVGGAFLRIPFSRWRVKTGIIKGAEARPTEKERGATGVELDQAPGEIRR